MDITQVFTVDVSQAVAGLGQFQASLGQVNAALGRTAGSGGAARANAQVAGLGNSAQTSTGQVRGLTLSWEALTRVVATQAIVSTFRVVRQLLADSVSDAAELQRQVGLIQTLQNPATDIQDVSGIAADVREISDSFNIPIVEAAGAAYDALSNQLGSFDEAIDFTAEAAQFGAATNSGLTDSVDLLSAALVAYNLDVSRTAEVSGILFNVIDEGRITADELANTFGRVGAPAAELGVSLEELGTTISSISVLGFRTSETLTQFRGILNSLQNETPALSEAIADIGFSSAQAAIQQLGLIGTLDALRQSTGGSAEAFTDLFPNIRGATGVIALLSRGVEPLNDSLQGMQAVTSDLARERALLVLDTDAEVLGNTLNRLRNEAVDFGNSVLALGRNFVDAVGGPEALTGSIRTLAEVITPVIGTFALLAGGIAAASVAYTRFIAVVAATNPYVRALTAIVALGVAVERFGSDLNRGDSVENLRDQIADLGEQASDTQATINQITRSSQQNAQNISRELSQFFASRSADFSRVQDEFIGQNNALVSNTEGILARITDARRQFLAQVESQIRNIDSLVEQSQQRVVGLEDNIEQNAFDFRIEGLGDVQQIQELSTRASNLAREAARDLANAGADEDQIGRSLDVFQQAQAEAERAQSIAQALGNRRLEAEAASDIQRILQQQVRAEEQLQRTQRERQEQARRELAEQRESLNEIERLAGIVLDNTGQFDSEGNQFSVEEQRERARLQGEALRGLQSEAFDRQDLNLAQILDLTSFVNQFSNELSNQPIRLDFDVVGESQQVAENFSDNFANLRVQFAGLFDPLEARLGETIVSFEQFFQALNEAQEFNTEASNAAAELANDRTLLANATTAAATAERELAELLRTRELNSPGNTTPEFTSGDQILAENSIAAIEAVQALGDNGTLQDLERIQTAFTRTTGNSGFFTDLIGQAGELRDLARETIDLAIQEQTIRDRVVQAEATFADGGQFNADEINEVSAIQGALSSTLELLIANREIELNPVTADALTNAQTLSQTLTTINNQIESISNIDFNVTANVGDLTNQQFGGAGLQFFNNGGFARGVDTIPAMLAPGESVINARSTQRFFSQIQALNAGQTPVFRAQNGGTTNVGDISVTVQGDSGNPAKTGRQIAQSLNRELRRRTSRL